MAFEFPVDDVFNEVSENGKTYVFPQIDDSRYARHALRKNRKFIKDMVKISEQDDLTDNEADALEEGIYTLIEDVYRNDEKSLLAFDLIAAKESDDEEAAKDHANVMGEWFLLFMGGAEEALPKDHQPKSKKN